MNRLTNMLFSTAFFALLLSCGGSDKRIAKIAGDNVTEKQLAVFSREHGKNGTLDDFIRREIAFRMAEKEGLTKSKDFEAAIKRESEAALRNVYIDSKAKPLEFSEKDARDFYFRHEEKALASHILFTTGSEASLAKLRISGGEKFEAAARELSTDPTTKEKGGDLGWISKGMTVQPFEEALFSGKKGDVLGPVKTQYGYHLILVRDLKSPSDEEFERNKADILKAMKNNQAASLKEKILGTLRVKYPLKAYDSVLELDRTTQVSEGDDARIAGNVAGSDITLAELKLFMAEVMKVRGGGHSLGAKTKISFMEILADDKRLIKAAEDEQTDKSGDYLLLKEDLVKDKAFDTLKERFLKDFEPETAAMEEFYKSNMDLFRELSGVRLNIIVAASTDDAQKAVLESNSSDFSSLYKKYADKEATGDMDTGFIDISSLAKFFPPEAIEQIAGGRAGEVVGPFGFQDGFVVMKIIEKKFTDSPSFAHSRDKVRAEFLKRNGDEAFRNHLDTEGRKAFKVEFFSAR